MTPASSRTLVERYALPPAEIEALSLERVSAALAAVGSWPDPEAEIVRRVVYAAGDPTLAPLIRFHPEAVAAGVMALRAGRAIVVDVRMVEVALDYQRIARLGCPVHCQIDAREVREEAARLSLPRAVVAVRALVDAVTDGVVVIGNAPTALLSLLDLVDAGRARPALVVGMPVGFVAAAESKAELARRAVPFITIEGTRGGSAVAAAACNALLRLAVDGWQPQDARGEGGRSHDR